MLKLVMAALAVLALTVAACAGGNDETAAPAPAEPAPVAQPSPTVPAPEAMPEKASSDSMMKVPSSPIAGPEVVTPSEPGQKISSFGKAGRQDQDDRRAGTQARRHRHLWRAARPARGLRHDDDHHLVRPAPDRGPHLGQRQPGAAVPDDDVYAVCPGLATEWDSPTTTSRCGTSPSVRACTWHDGTALTAEDMKFWLDLVFEGRQERREGPQAGVVRTPE